ncbi:SOS response-associated protein YedK [Burkholderiales bacterium]|nr:SOS response-associated protein YedK [Burkholderiales bacterium]
MCGRYELHAHPAAIALAFGLAEPPGLAPRYNIAPMQQVPIVRVNAHGVRELVHVRWGLVPRWAKDPSIGARMINARGETVRDKPAFRTAYRRHRCLVPADGFYEWATRGDDKGARQPVHIGMKDGATFAFAGLAERWLGPDGEPLDTCAIVTTDANALLTPVHDRMPVIVAPRDYARWLDPAVADPSELIAPCPDDAIRVAPVSTRVNSVRHDDPSLIEPLRPSAADAPGDDAPTGPAPVPGPPKQSALF